MSPFAQQIADKAVAVAGAPPLRALFALSVVGCAAPGSAPVQPLSAASECYDRERGAQNAIVDAHLHPRPFGGEAVPFDELMGYLRRAGVRHALLYGIGQMLPTGSECAYYLDCPGTPVMPTLKNDFANALSVLESAPSDIQLTLSMTFPDLSRPEEVLQGMDILDKEFPGMFRWMGEVNLVKQALWANGRTPTPASALGAWGPFMKRLRERDIPIAIHSDLGSDREPLRFLPLMEEALDLYPDNVIVWMHMGLSKELATMDSGEHIRTMERVLERYPRLFLDISWRVLHDNYFSRSAADRAAYAEFLNNWSERILPGTDFLASANKTSEVYLEELALTSSILGELDDAAFRRIALGGNYFRLLGLDQEPAPICSSG